MHSSDEGPQFANKDFTEFAKALGFPHMTSMQFKTSCQQWTSGKECPNGKEDNGAGRKKSFVSGIIGNKSRSVGRDISYFVIFCFFMVAIDHPQRGSNGPNYVHAFPVSRETEAVMRREMTAAII